MNDDEKLRFIFIMSAIVAALVVHRFVPVDRALPHNKPALVKATRVTLSPLM